MNTNYVFRADGKFYKLDQKFEAKLKPVMSKAREDYKKEWVRTNYSSPAKSVPTFFRDDYRSTKETFGDQIFYVKSRGGLYRRDGNTADMRVIAPIYHINNETKKIGGIGFIYKGLMSSAMLELTPIDKFPWEDKELWNNPEAENGIAYKDLACERFGRDPKIFKALDGPNIIDAQSDGPYNMYGTGKHYSNAYNDGYVYVDGQVLDYREWKRAQQQPVSTTVNTDTMASIDRIVVTNTTTGTYTPGTNTVTVVNTDTSIPNTQSVVLQSGDVEVPAYLTTNTITRVDENGNVQTTINPQ